jgi:hypothetical protein
MTGDPVTHRRILFAAACIVLLPVSLAGQALVHNDTGLPTYPRLKSGEVAEWNIDHKDLYHVYKSSSTDKMADVEAWYRHALPHATEAPKDAGIESELKLQVGKDVVNIFDLHQFGENAVEIDLMKYKGPAPRQ